jgi:vesicle-fusing ATPase
MIYDLKFENLGIGGLDDEFKVLFRKAFLSRTLNADMVKDLKMKHSKGILLYGPPGCGKTLIAREISKLFSATLKIVNGPEIFNKYVGQSEQNMRDLFKDAQEEYKLRGEKSKLHIVVFDEFDSIAVKRNESRGDSGVGNKVVNQLLTIMDGVEMFNNLLIIGLTNRKDFLDPALLRPGRFDVQIEIKAPDENGIRQIYKIKTKHLEEGKYLAEDFDIEQLVGVSKNFTGAEIESAVNGAVNIALFRRRNQDDPLLIRMEDFLKSVDEVTQDRVVGEIKWS